MFLSHYIILIFSIIVIMNSTRFTKWSIFGTIIFILLFIAYVLVISRVLKIECNTTGLSIGDWYNPHPGYFWYSQYGVLNNLTNFSFLFNVIFWYLIASCFIILIIIARNLLVKNIKYRNPKLWWSKLLKIDNFVNKIF